MGADLGPLLAGFGVSALGFVLFYYGRRMRRIPQLATGLVLMVYPYFVSGILAMLAIAVVLVLAMWFAIQRGF
jgi:hypothetical protein